jgi:nucleoside-diphosphate-sugar epimerase
VALAKSGDEVEVWGDGKQTRSFMYIDDCLEGLLRIMESDAHEPINLGTEELITIDGLYGLVCEIAGKKLRLKHNPSKPQGVRGRNSDNTMIRARLRWEPQIPPKDGLVPTYQWIRAQLRLAG